MFCLPKLEVGGFLEKLKSGEINPEELIDMTSAERREFFGKFLSEDNAKQVNALLESKLLLKNQQQGIITWAKQIAGLKPEIRRDIISRVEKLTEVLSPQEEKAFLEDLAAQKLGVGVTVEEARKIADFSKNVSDKKVEMQNGGDRLEYGRAVVGLENYVKDLKVEAKRTTLQDFKERPLQSAAKAAGEVPGLAKSLKASLDDSAIFRQGWKTLWTNPTIWLKNARQSFVDLARSFGGKEVVDEVRADIVSRPNYDLMRKAKLAVGTTEETFPTSLPEKVPVLGRAYKASEAAFTAFVYRQRADVFDKYIEIAKKSGVDVSDPQELKAIGKLVNSLTGRGDLGSWEANADKINNVFFSPRAVKSHIDTLLLHPLDRGENFSGFARKQAAINLLKIVTGTAAVLATANAAAPGSVEKDPRSSDFGKIKVGDTRFDVTGGMSSLLVLAMRLATQSSKSSTSGKVTKIDSGAFGASTTGSVLTDFLTNKLSPVASVIHDLRVGHDFSGNKATPLNEVNNLLTPLPITNYEELKSDPNSANKLLAIIADSLGIGTNTYASTNSARKPSTR